MRVHERGFAHASSVVVDANVTRHLPELLDADIAILHYLGVDHAGHLSGPNGSLMAAKLLEMDAVVERLWQHLVARDAKDGQRTLLVVLGDHGMTAAGNHGGASAGETRAVREVSTGDADRSGAATRIAAVLWVEELARQG